MSNEYHAFAPNQEYTKEYLKELKEKDLVIYDGRACLAIRIIPREDFSIPLFEILGEDDGHLFSYSSPIQLSLYWMTPLIEHLNEAKAYWEEIKENYQ